MRFPVIDFSALAVVGVHLNNGDSGAIGAIVANIDRASEDIAGQEVVIHAPLTMQRSLHRVVHLPLNSLEDDHVFVVILPVYPDCYQVTRDTPVIDGTLPGTLPTSASPDFALTPPDEASDPNQFAALKKAVVFKEQEDWHLLRLGC